MIRLREWQVIDIKRNWKGPACTRRLAKKHRITMRAVQLIVSGDRWGWLKVKKYRRKR